MSVLSRPIPPKIDDETLREFLNTKPSFTKLLSELKGVSEEKLEIIISQLAVNGKNGDSSKLRAKTNCLRTRCKKAITGFKILRNEGYNLSESINIRKRIKSPKITQFDVKNLVDLKAKLSWIWKNSNKEEMFYIPSTLSNTSTGYLDKCKCVTFANLPLNIPLMKKLHNEGYKGVVLNTGYYRWNISNGHWKYSTCSHYNWDLTKSYDPVPSPLEKIRDPKCYIPLSALESAFTVVLNSILKGEGKQYFPPKILWIPSVEKELYLKTLRTKYNIVNLVCDELKKFPLATKIPQERSKKERKRPENSLRTTGSRVKKTGMSDKVNNLTEVKSNPLCNKCKKHETVCVCPDNRLLAKLFKASQLPPNNASLPSSVVVTQRLAESHGLGGKCERCHTVGKFGHKCSCGGYMTIPVQN